MTYSDHDADHLSESCLHDRPPMTSREVALVRESFALVAPIADVAAELIYRRIFELAPAARAMFPADLEAQGRHLIEAVATVVRLLDDQDRLADVLGRLGARHVGYGVVPEHFAIVGEAVLWALEQGLGPAYTGEVDAAWRAAYAVIERGMLAGMTPAMAG